jgi:hypothetical protein
VLSDERASSSDDSLLSLFVPRRFLDRTSTWPVRKVYGSSMPI